MKAPDKIYVHRTVHLGLLSASEIDITGSDEQYIRKDALLEWLVARNREIDGDPKALWRSLEIRELYNKIRSL